MSRPDTAIVGLRLAALLTILLIVPLLWRLMLLAALAGRLPAGDGGRVRVRLQVRARDVPVMQYRVTQANRTRFRDWFFQGIRQARRRTARAAHPSGAVVEGDVPDGRRLLLDARIPAGHRVYRGRRARTDRDDDPRRPHARRRAAGLQPGRRREPERPGQHLDARRSAAALARQGVRPRAARIRGHRLRHHHHALGGRRHRAHHPQPVRARRVRSPDRGHDRAADRARRDLPEGLSGSDWPRRGRSSPSISRSTWSCSPSASARCWRIPSTCPAGRTRS